MPRISGAYFLESAMPPKFSWAVFFCVFAMPRISGALFRKSAMPPNLQQCNIFRSPDGDT